MALNQDYINEITPFFFYFRAGKLDELKKFPKIKTYKERYPDAQKNGNDSEIQQLDTLVNFLNALRESPKLKTASLDFLNGIFDEISLILYGEKREYKRVPQINSSTGVSEVYWTSFKLLDIEFKRNGLTFLPEYIKTHRLLRYHEMFSPVTFVDVVTDKNKLNVLKLDEIVETFNILQNAPEADKLNHRRKLINPATGKYFDYQNYGEAIVNARKFIFNGYSV